MFVFVFYWSWNFRLLIMLIYWYQNFLKSEINNYELCWYLVFSHWFLVNGQSNGKDISLTLTHSIWQIGKMEYGWNILEIPPCAHHFRLLFIIIFRPEMLKFHPYSILTGDIRVEFVIYCMLKIPYLKAFRM